MEEVTGRLGSSPLQLPKRRDMPVEGLVAQEGSPSKEKKNKTHQVPHWDIWGREQGTQSFPYIIGGRRLVLKGFWHLGLLSLFVWSPRDVPVL